MIVSSIIETKGSDVVTAGAGNTVGEIASVLSEKRIGAVVVLDDNQKVCGIISERDIVQQIASQGSEALNQPIENCMTSNVISCELTDSVNQVMEKMSSGRFRHLPITTNGKLNGIISIGDVVKARIEEIERDAEDMKRYIAG